MARLHHTPEKYGTYDNICIYPRCGKPFMRLASSLTSERVKKDPAFKRTMANASQLGIAARLAGAVYHMLAPSRRKRFNYRIMVGRAIRLLKAGHTEGETVVELMIYIQLPKRVRKKRGVVANLHPKAVIRVMVSKPVAGKTRLQAPYCLPGPGVRLQCVGHRTEIYRYYG